jgi:hypothetical protein
MHGIRQPQAGISHSRHHPCHRRLPVVSGRPIGGRIDLDPHGLVLVDQTAAATDRLRGSGRRLRVVRCRICVPHGHDETATAALPKTLKDFDPAWPETTLGGLWIGARGLPDRRIAALRSTRFLTVPFGLDRKAYAASPENLSSRRGSSLPSGWKIDVTHYKA